jgi:hypothetical protein
LEGDVVIAMDCEPHRMSEPVLVQDIFVSGLGEVEDLGGRCFRFTFFSRQHIGDREELVVVAKLVAPIEAVPPALMMAAKAIGFSLAGGTYIGKNGMN